MLKEFDPWGGVKHFFMCIDLITPPENTYSKKRTKRRNRQNQTYGESS